MPRPKKTATLRPAAYPHQAYGQGVDAIHAQQQIPLPNEVANQAPTPGAAGPPPGAPAAPQPMPADYAGPVSVTPLDAPTGRPDEHIMSGAPMGPGPGPEAQVPAPGSANGDVLAQLQAVVSMGFANPGIVNLIDSIKSGDYTAGGSYGKALGQP